MPSTNSVAAIRPARILIVEDEYFVALNAQQLLEDAGFVVTGIAMSAAEALDMAGRDGPEIVLMDIRLRGSPDGVDAAISLRTKFDLPCIFVTAHAEWTVQQRAQPARPMGWLQKPYSELVLIETINKALASAAPASE